MALPYIIMLFLCILYGELQYKSRIETHMHRFLSVDLSLYMNLILEKKSDLENHLLHDHHILYDDGYRWPKADNNPSCAKLACVKWIIFLIAVGNIPYEATEEQLKEIFLQAGPIVSFRYDLLFWKSKVL